MMIVKGKATAAIRYRVASEPSVAQTSTVISTAMSDEAPSRAQVGSRKNWRRVPDEAKGDAAEDWYGPNECV